MRYLFGFWILDDLHLNKIKIGKNWSIQWEVILSLNLIIFWKRKKLFMFYLPYNIVFEFN